MPGYPLDGGRVLRAILWGIYQDPDRATRYAATAGQIVAGLLIAGGFYRFILGAGFGGLWLAFIGWFLLLAAQAEYAQATVGDALRGVRVADVVGQDCAAVDADTDLQSVVEDVLLKSGRRCVMVQRNAEVMGLLTTNELREVDRPRWVDVPVRDVMRRLDELKTVTPETAATEALTTMAREDLNQLPVISRGRLEGMVSRGRILQVLQSRIELTA